MLVADRVDEERQGAFDKILLKVSRYQIVKLEDLASTLLQVGELKGTSAELVGSNEKATKKLASKIISKLKNLKSRANPEDMNNTNIIIEHGEHCYNDHHEKQ